MITPIKKAINFSFLGNGGISKIIQETAIAKNHHIQSLHDKGDEWNFENANLIIECTTPESFLNHFEQLCAFNKDIIIVTTGWYDHLETIKKIALDANIRVLWSSNFSIGVYLYNKIVESAAKLINNYDDYDIWATELHHRMKVDSPSGTAKILGNILLNNIDRKTSVVEKTLQRAINEEEIHFTSTRGGAINFTHTVGFDSAEDVIEIKHTARNRNGYAVGVVKAAEWLQNQKSGFFSMEDLIK